MILKAADGTVYKVHFRHWLPCKPVHIRGKGLCRAVTVYRAGPRDLNRSDKYLGMVLMQEFAKQPKTRCYVHQGDCHQPWQLCLEKNTHLRTGEARLKKGDTFTKRLGRWISLNRALDEYTDDQSLREQLLESYKRQLLPRCDHKFKDGSPCWVAMEGFDYCPRCHARRNKSVDL